VASRALSVSDLAYLVSTSSVSSGGYAAYLRSCVSGIHFYRQFRRICCVSQILRICYPFLSSVQEDMLRISDLAYLVSISNVSSGGYAAYLLKSTSQTASKSVLHDKKHCISYRPIYFTPYMTNLISLCIKHSRYLRSVQSYLAENKGCGFKFLSRHGRMFASFACIM
jgi:hypothetical protein